MRGLCTAPVICWRSVWRRRPASQLVVFRQAGVTPSGLGAFLLLFFLKTWSTSSSLICSAGVGGGGLQEGRMVFFQTCNRTHSDHLPIVDSPQCWGMVFCNWWCLSDLSTLRQNHWKIICSLVFQNNSSLPLWSPFPVCIWPVYTTRCPPSCKHLLWPDGAVLSFAVNHGLSLL